MKKKSCRMTAEEKDLHERAIRIRKMTDRQLVEHIEHIREEAYTTGYAEGETKNAAPATTGKTLADFIGELAEGRCKGVKSATAYKIEEFARTAGYIV